MKPYLQFCVFIINNRTLTVYCVGIIDYDKSELLCVLSRSRKCLRKSFYLCPTLEIATQLKYLSQKLRIPTTLRILLHTEYRIRKIQGVQSIDPSYHHCIAQQPSQISHWSLSIRPSEPIKLCMPLKHCSYYNTFLQVPTINLKTVISKHKPKTLRSPNKSAVQTKPTLT